MHTLRTCSLELNFLCNEIYNTCQSYCMTVSKNNMWASHGLDKFCVRPYLKGMVDFTGSGLWSADADCEPMQIVYLFGKKSQ